MSYFSPLLLHAGSFLSRCVGLAGVSGCLGASGILGILRGGNWKTATWTSLLWPLTQASSSPSTAQDSASLSTGAL